MAVNARVPVTSTADPKSMFVVETQIWNICFGSVETGIFFDYGRRENVFLIRSGALKIIMYMFLVGAFETCKTSPSESVTLRHHQFAVVQ